MNVYDPLASEYADLAHHPEKIRAMDDGDLMMHWLRTRTLLQADRTDIDRIANGEWVRTVQMVDRTEDAELRRRMTTPRLTDIQRAAIKHVLTTAWSGDVGPWLDDDAVALAPLIDATYVPGWGIIE